MSGEVFSLDWLSDPTIFAVNRLPAVSDHEFFADRKEADRGESSLVRSLKGTWKAHFCMNAADAPDALLTDGSEDDALMDIPVPCEFQLVNPDWNPAHYVNTMYITDGWEELYPPEVSKKHNPTVTAVRRFNLEEKDLNCGRIVLTLNGVEPSCLVYLNGQFIGYAEDSFTPHRFDVTKAVKVGENRLAVRVFKRCTGNWIEDQDFWRFSGIHRDVTLTFEPAAHLADVFVHTPLFDDYTRAQVRTELTVDRPQGSVRLELAAPDGTLVLDQTVPAQEKLEITGEVLQPRLWTAETPDLYTMTVTLLNEAGAEVEVSRLEVGIREFRIDNKIMKLNGKRIVFHGVNRHEFDCDTGRVMSRELMERDIRDMKSLNMNAVRTCHYPNDSYLYKLCDRYGLYMIDETNIESHGSWKHPEIYGDWNVPGDRPEWLPATIDRGRSMLERDKNHASVLFWSCGNEAFGGWTLLELSNFFRQRDPSRVVHYEGVQNDPRHPEITDVETRMYPKVVEIREYLENDPPKPFISCEYTHAMGNSCGGMSLYTELEDEYPMYQGGFIWDYVDQGLHTTAPNGAERFAYGGDFGDRPTDYQFNINGIELADRSHTPKCQEVAFLFREADLTPDEKGVTIRNRRFFTDLSDCVLVGQVQLNGRVVCETEIPAPAVKPGESLHVDLAWKLPEESGEVALTVWMKLAADKGVQPKGHVAAYGQTVLGSWQPEQHNTPAASVVSDYNIGAHTDAINVMLGRFYYGLESVKDAVGKECVLHTPRLSMFRAATDNDMGNGDNVLDGPWMALTCSGGKTLPVVDRSSGLCTMTYNFYSPAIPGLQVPITYALYHDALKVTLEYPGTEVMRDVPAFGLSLQLDKRLSHVKYYGMGPEDNYVDRCEGALLGRYAYEVEEGWTRYALPQESGNRMGVREMTITDDDGHGIHISMEDCPLEISVQPWLPEEIAAAWHPDELQGSVKTVLDVAMFRRGIGGDDSWGAPVLEQFKYPANKPYSFSFWIRGI